MKTLKMSLENIQGKMSRMEMRNIMAGSGPTCSNNSCVSLPCCFPNVDTCKNGYCTTR